MSPRSRRRLRPRQSPKYLHDLLLMTSKAGSGCERGQQRFSQLLREARCRRRLQHQRLTPSSRLCGRRCERKRQQVRFGIQQQFRHF
mmetsp:Transcript_106892/g.333212  ORF Transcript_106892/g.333212 Transcript_106892/m.333212 type:complete len:87 (+) Transcript_106892:41-301(+)